MEEKDIQEELVNDEEIVASEPGKYDALMAEQSTKRLTGMYKNWFLDYASYVILERAVPVYVAGVLFAAAREGFACEVVARRNAMDSAGKNATTMIDDLQLKYNRARQGAITQEITEIVAGSGE